MKLGIKLKIELTNELRDSIYTSEKTGRKYISLSTFVDPDEEDQYGNHGGIAIEQTKEQRDSGEKATYVGNAKVFWKGDSEKSFSKPSAPVQQKRDFIDDDIPF